MSKDMVEHVKLAHKLVDVVDLANRKSCVTLLRYDVDKPKNFYAQVQKFAREKEDEKMQQIVYVNHEPKELIYLFDVMNCVCDTTLAN